MNIIEKIQLIGSTVAAQNEIVDFTKVDKINLPDIIVEDFITRIVHDFFEFQTTESPNITPYNLFARAFMYVYGKGAEVAFFTRQGIDVQRIYYDFDKALDGICAELLPEKFAFHSHKKSSMMLEMYHQMFDATKGSQEQNISDGLNFGDCVNTILNGGFFYGKALCLTLKLSEEDKLFAFREESKDNPYNYDKKYELSDFKIVNYSIGNFNDIKNILKNRDLL